MSSRLNAIRMGVRVGLVLGKFDKRADETARTDREDVSERTNGGVLIFFSLLFLSTCISTYGIWLLARYLIHHY